MFTLARVSENAHQLSRRPQVQHAIAEIKKALIEGATMALEVRARIPRILLTMDADELLILLNRPSNVNKPLAVVAPRSADTPWSKKDFRYLFPPSRHPLPVRCSQFSHCIRCVEPHLLPTPEPGSSGLALDGTMCENTRLFLPLVMR